MKKMYEAWEDEADCRIVFGTLESDRIRAFAHRASSNR